MASVKIHSAQAGHFFCPARGSGFPAPQCGHLSEFAGRVRGQAWHTIQPPPLDALVALVVTDALATPSDGSAMATKMPMSGLRKNDRKKKPMPLRPF
ncbi:MAG: hypothetical protein WCL04_05080 [Verrucomicrobiota bacterium]